jgi:hypothetical protein
VSAFEKWYGTPASASGNPKDWYRACWDAALDEAALAVKGIKDRKAIRALKTAHPEGR